MFSTDSIGKRIAEARKEKNMTQMELADVMEVSFQVVSNWERGISMPDISKLPELSRILDITVDELLGKESSLIQQVIENEMAGSQKSEIIAQSGEEILEAAPILKPKQLDQIVRDSKEMLDFSEIEDLLPFLGKELCGELFMKCIECGEQEEASDIAPFVEKEFIEKGVELFLEKGMEFEDLLPFTYREAKDRIAWKVYVQQGMEAAEDYYPFISREMLQKIGEAEYEKNGLKNFECIAPFISRENLDALAKKAIEKDGIKAISDLAPFLSREVLAEYVKERYL